MPCMSSVVETLRPLPMQFRESSVSTGSTANTKPTGGGIRRLRTIFLSDIHLGTPGCKALHLIDFLRHHQAEQLYLIGDVIDAWALRRRFFWPQSHNDVVQKVLRCARKGTRVIFVPGNHDEVGRQFAG